MTAKPFAFSLSIAARSSLSFQGLDQPGGNQNGDGGNEVRGVVAQVRPVEVQVRPTGAEERDDGQQAHDVNHEPGEGVQTDGGDRFVARAGEGCGTRPKTVRDAVDYVYDRVREA